MLARIYWKESRCKTGVLSHPNSKQICQFRFTKWNRIGGIIPVQIMGFEVVNSSWQPWSVLGPNMLSGIVLVPLQVKPKCLRFGFLESLILSPRSANFCSSYMFCQAWLDHSYVNLSFLFDILKASHFSNLKQSCRGSDRLGMSRQTTTSASQEKIHCPAFHQSTSRNHRPEQSQCCLW